MGVDYLTSQIFAISHFSGARDNQPRADVWTWADIRHIVRNADVRAAKDGAAFAPAVFERALRSKANVRAVSLLVMDYDHGADLTRECAVWAAQGLAYAAYTTHSSYRITENNPNAEERFRVIVPLTEPIPGADYPALWDWAYTQSGERIDRQAKDASRLYYLPAVIAVDAEYVYRHVDGASLDWRPIVAAAQRRTAAPKTQPGPILAKSVAYGAAALRDEAHRVMTAANGHRNDRLNKSAFAIGRLVGAGAVEQSEAVETLARAAVGAGLPDAEARRTIASGMTAGIAEPRTIPTETTAPKEPPNLSSNSFFSSDITEWPEMTEAVYHGLAGDLVRAIEPHTEADPAALLLQFLVAFGNAIGRSAHFTAEADGHYGNLFVAIVGNTSKGRKGTSWGQTKRLLGDADPDWLRDCLASGMSSGEGIIWAVRDQIEKTEAIKEKGKVADYQQVVTDPGIKDKRLLIVESELASVLKVAVREGNTITAIIREAWDTGNFRSLTKNSPAKATGAHVSIIGHITRDELLRHLDNTEAANGFANRFLWVCSKRSKSLPDGGKLADVNFNQLANQLTSAVDHAKKMTEMKRNEGAADLWRAVYDDLSTGQPGLLGAVTARAEAQVMRLAMLYALLDCEEMIGEAHLRAGLAVWRYAEQSARYIFGDAMGDPIADSIIAALQEAGEDGLTRSQLWELSKRNASASALNRALASLLESGRAISRKDDQPDGAKGRPAERWILLSYVTKETKETKEMGA